MGRARTISFKADADLAALLGSVRNRSEFIRAAVLAALDSSCPLCRGSGVLGPQQRREWDAFAASHPRLECGRCHEQVLSCAGRPTRHACRSGHGRH